MGEWILTTSILFRILIEQCNILRQRLESWKGP